MSIFMSCVFCFLHSAPVQCVLDKDSLADGLRVLIPMDDQLLYAGHVHTVHSPDMYVYYNLYSYLYYVEGPVDA